MSTARAIVMGASAGGVEALLKLLGALPVDFQLPILTVLHLPDERHSQLADVFQKRLHRRVKEAQDKESIQPGHLYFACPGYHLSVELDCSLSLSQEEHVHYSRPSIDILFESAADAYGPGLVGVLLTGANEDGARGLKRIKQLGGLTVVQDPDEAKVDVMPRAALGLQIPDYILPLSGIARLLADLDKDPC